MAQSAVPLFVGQSLAFVSHAGRTIRGPEELEVRGESLACLGPAADLIPCVPWPERLRSGQLTLLGERPAELLSSLKAGYAPQELPAPDSFRLREALILGARLVGSGKPEVHEVAERLQLARLLGKKLGELTVPQRRLAGLAHGLVGSPELVLIEDPFAQLDDASAQLVETLLETELANKKWIAGVTLDSPWSRRLLARAQSALTADVGTLVSRELDLLGPFSPAEIKTDVFWGRFTRVTDELHDALSAQGAKVTRTPHPQVLLIQALSGLSIAETALEAGRPLLELTPAG